MIRRARSIKIHVINTISIFLIVIAFFTVTGCIVLASKPFRESGSAPEISGTAESSGTKQTKAWEGTSCNFLFCGVDETNKLTDVIMVVNFDNSNGKIRILQIPRDTFAGSDIPTYKYNAVYGHHDKNVSGMEYLKTRVESDFGIPIQYYAAVTTKGLRSLVDAAGGVDLDVPIDMNYDDPAQNLHIHLKKGYQHLNGNMAEQFVRFRKGWTEGDLGRMNAQKIFLAAFADKLKTLSILTLTTKVAPELLPPNFMTDMSTMQMIQFGLAAQKVQMNSVTVFTVPGESFKYRGYSLYSVHKEPLIAILNSAFVPQGRVLKSSDLKIKEMKNSEETSKNPENFESIIGKDSNSVSSR